jgi:hypothetical protein
MTMFATLAKLFKVGTPRTQVKAGLAVKTALKCGNLLYGKGRK